MVETLLFSFCVGCVCVCENACVRVHMLHVQLEAKCQHQVASSIALSLILETVSLPEPGVLQFSWPVNTGIPQSLRLPRPWDYRCASLYLGFHVAC